MVGEYISRIQGRFRRVASALMGRRNHQFELCRPLISFTFDDFPKSAASVAARILEEQGVLGTFYTSFGLIGSEAPTGRIFDAEDFQRLDESGHELGCHTFDHLPAWSTATSDFLRSVSKNAEFLNQLLPGRKFLTLSFPLEEPQPRTKAALANRFICCRAGGQCGNSRELDANGLSSFFLDARNADDWLGIQRQIRLNKDRNGWLIFSTHDVGPDPTPYGCSIYRFRQVLDESLRSGARIIPVAAAWKYITGCVCDG